jgi:hypothetical protein
MALTFNDTLAELMQARVMERMTLIAEELASGSAGENIARYQNRVGFCHGLRESLEILADVQKILQER